MALLPVRGLYCLSEHMITGGKTDTGKQRYRCLNPACSHQSFLLDSAYKGCSPQVKQQVIELSLNGSGGRDTARVRGIQSGDGHSRVEKKGGVLTPVNHRLRKRLPPSRVEVALWRVRGAEGDEMWSFVGKKKEPR